MMRKENKLKMDILLTEEMKMQFNVKKLMRYMNNTMGYDANNLFHFMAT